MTLNTVIRRPLNEWSKVNNVNELVEKNVLLTHFLLNREKT